jgi:Beta xylosidase C-terminal Concanavalin A-like domain
LHAALAVRCNDHGRQLILRINGSDQPLGDTDGKAVTLRVEVQDGGACVFSFAGDGGIFTRVDNVFQARSGEWIGARLGLYCLNPNEGLCGHADFDFFRFSPSECSPTRV